MKTNKFATIAALCAMAGLTACDNGSNDDPQEVTVTYTFENDLDFTRQGYWTGAYDVDQLTLMVPPNMVLTHYASQTEYAGVTYKSWKGFVPSRAHDGTDHTGSDWTEYQWSAAMADPNAATAGAGGSMDYILGCWATEEGKYVNTGMLPPVDEMSCVIRFLGGAKPQHVYINNSNWGYWAMKNGSAFSKAFGPDDYCYLIINALRIDTNNKNSLLKTGELRFALAENGRIVNTWQLVDLTGLGQVDYLYFQMESSDTGQWGMNNPAFFCLDNLTALITQ